MVKWLWVMVACSVSGLIFWLATQGNELTDSIKALPNLDLRVVFLALSLIALSSLIDACRWKLLLPGEGVSIPRLFLVKNAGMSLNNVSPIRLLAEPAQAAMLKFGDGIATEKVVASLAVAHLLELFVKAAVIGIALMFLPQLGHFTRPTLVMLGIATAGVAGIFLFRKGAVRIPALGRIRQVDSILKAMGVIWTDRRLGASCLALTALSWFIIGATSWMLARTLGIELSLWLMPMSMMAIITFSGVIPGPPGAVGVYEASTVYILGQFSVEPQAALTFAIISHGMLFLTPMLIGLPAFAFNGQTTAQILGASLKVLGIRQNAPDLKKAQLEPQPQILL